MPLRVKCPNGCLIRVPSKHAGKVIRCPKCKTAIRVGTVVNDDSRPAENAPRQPVTQRETNESASAIGISHSTDPSAGKISNEGDHWIIRVATDETEVKNADQLADRVERARRDRVLLGRFFAVFMLLVAAINVAPSVYGWYQWSEESGSGQLPRWTYLQIFVAALHVIYALFIVQVADWSALKAVSVALLVMAVVFGFVSTGLVTGGAEGIVAQFLDLPYVMSRNATIWCLAMLLLAMMTSYLCGREAMNWQRTEKVFYQIISQRTQA